MHLPFFVDKRSRGQVCYLTPVGYYFAYSTALVSRITLILI